jgi:hypothetical protein
MWSNSSFIKITGKVTELSFKKPLLQPHSHFLLPNKSNGVMALILLVHKPFVGAVELQGTILPTLDHEHLIGAVVLTSHHPPLQLFL